MRAFNSFQAVCIYTALPFAMSYLSQFDTPKSNAMFAVCAVALVIGAALLTTAVCEATDSK